MSMWWLEPGWKNAACGACGANIWASGGDPDHGLCFPCMDGRLRQKACQQEDERAYHREAGKAYYAQMEGDMEYQSWSAG